MRPQDGQAALVKRWQLGHAAAAERQRRLLAEEGPALLRPSPSPSPR